MADSDLDYAKVTGRFGITVGDDSDPDELPGIVYCSSGKIELYPLQPQVGVIGADPPATLVNSVLTARINRDGYLENGGVPRVWVVDLTSEKVNPRIGDDAATHRVVFSNVRAGSRSIVLPEVTVRITAAGPNGDGINDLTQLMPVLPGAVAPMFQGPPGTSIETAAVEDGELVFGFSDGTVVDTGGSLQTAIIEVAAPKRFGRDPLYPPAKIVWPIPAHPAPPKVTMTAANPSYSQTQVIALPDPRVLITGTELKTVGAYQQPGHLSTADNFTIPPFGIEFWTDTNIVRLVFAGFGFNYRLLVDGEWAHGASDTPAYTVNADGGDHHILLEFTTRKVRHLRFEMQGPVKSVIVPADATVWRPKLPAVRAICVGDSFTLDNVSSDQTVSRLTPYPVALGKLMGWDAWASGVGGSGYLSTGGGGVVKFRDRLAPDVVPYAPDVVVWCGGHNDGGFTAAQVRAEARLCWEYVAANVPGVRQIVVSPFSQNASIASTREAIRAGLALEAADMGLPYVDVLSPNIWTGTGKRGATTGDGNSDYYVNTDGVHPTPDGLGGGSTYIAVRAAQLIQNIVQEVA